MIFCKFGHILDVLAIFGQSPKCQQNIPNASPKYHQNITKMSPKYHQYVTKILARFHQNITQLSPIYHQYVTKISTRPRRSCIADCMSCTSTAYFCISDVPRRISDLTSRTAPIRRFRNSHRIAKSEFWKLRKTSQKLHCRLYFLYFHSVFLYF